MTLKALSAARLQRALAVAFLTGNKKKKIQINPPILWYINRSCEKKTKQKEKIMSNENEKDKKL